MAAGQPDHQLVGEFVTNEWPDSARSLTEFSRVTGVSVTTLRRLMAGDESIKASTRRAVERGLDVPPRTLDLIRDHDLAGLADEGLRDRSLRWLQRKVQPTNGPKVAPDLVVERTANSVTVREVKVSDRSGKGSRNGR
jgi:transcriptional regulator with XRE-family HTH domain